jgi:hypothetical protein
LTNRGGEGTMLEHQGGAAAGGDGDDEGAAAGEGRQEYTLVTGGL